MTFLMFLIITNMNYTALNTSYIVLQPFIDIGSIYINFYMRIYVIFVSDSSKVLGFKMILRRSVSFWELRLTDTWGLNFSREVNMAVCPPVNPVSPGHRSVDCKWKIPHCFRISAAHSCNILRDDSLSFLGKLPRTFFWVLRFYCYPIFNWVPQILQL